MEEGKQTKFKDGDTLNATEFGRLIGCSVQAVKRFMTEGKMTEGVSYLKEGNTIMIDAEEARKELRLNIRPATCKNPDLLEWLDLPTASNEILAELDKSLDGLSKDAIREETRKSELRISLINEGILSGKYVERSVVERNLESMGIEARNGFTGISAKLASEARAAGSDREAELIIHAGIEEALMKLSDITKRDIAERK